MSEIRLHRPELFLIAREMEKAAPWTKFHGDLERIIQVLREILTEVGVKSLPVVTPPKGLAGYWEVSALPANPCCCTARGFEQHSFACDKRNGAYHYAWSGLISATAGVSAPFRKPSVWWAAYEGQMALQMLGSSKEQAVDRLGISLDTIWIEEIRRYLEGGYLQDADMYTKNPQWLVDELAQAQESRRHFNQPLADWIQLPSL